GGHAAARRRLRVSRAARGIGTARARGVFRRAARFVGTADAEEANQAAHDKAGQGCVSHGVSPWVPIIAPSGGHNSTTGWSEDSASKSFRQQLRHASQERFHREHSSSPLVIVTRSAVDEKGLGGWVIRAEELERRQIFGPDARSPLHFEGSETALTVEHEV